MPLKAGPLSNHGPPVLFGQIMRPDLWNCEFKVKFSVLSPVQIITVGLSQMFILIKLSCFGKNTIKKGSGSYWQTSWTTIVFKNSSKNKAHASTQALPNTHIKNHIQEKTKRYNFHWGQNFCSKKNVLFESVCSREWTDPTRLCECSPNRRNIQNLFPAFLLGNV